MAEYIILTIILVLMVYAFIYLVKAIKSITMTEESVISGKNNVLDKKILIRNNLEELEIDYLSQKLDKAEYQALKENMKEEINSINSEDNNTNTNIKEENDKITCKNCKKEIEPDSKFCKYCGSKVNS